MAVITVIKPRRSLVPASIPLAADLEVGELTLNIPDGKFFTKDNTGVVKEVGGAGAVNLQGVTDISGVTTNNIILNGSSLVFEGQIENSSETFLTALEPTTDNIISLPNVTGTIITTGNLSDITSTGTLSSIVSSGSISGTSIISSGSISGTSIISSGTILGTDITGTNLNLLQNGQIIFEGSTNDDYETILTVLNPTADRTITIPNQSGILATEGDALAFAIVFGS